MDRKKKLPFPVLLLVFVLLVVLSGPALLLAGLLLAFLWRWLLVIGLIALMVLLTRSASIRGNRKARSDPDVPLSGLERRAALPSVKQRIQKSLPSSEPIRAMLIDVVDEALALRSLIDEAGAHGFSTPGFAQTLLPADFRKKSDAAVQVAVDLSERLALIHKASGNRPRSSQLSSAMEAQTKRVAALRSALTHSRGAIEGMIVSNGGAPGDIDELARSLRNLADAIDESYDQGFALSYGPTGRAAASTIEGPRSAIDA